MQAHQHPCMLDLVIKYTLPAQQLFGRTVTLKKVPQELMQMDSFSGVGVPVVDMLKS